MVIFFDETGNDIVNVNEKNNRTNHIQFLGMVRLRFVHYAIPILSICLSVWHTCDCDHTFKPIKKFLVLMESPKILVSEKVSFVHMGNP